jgi:hypothetical protein
MPGSIETRSAFAAKLNSVDEAPEPLRGAVTQALGRDKNVRCLIFGPLQKMIDKVSPSSLLAILDHERVVAVCGERAQPQVHRCSFAATLLAELTEVLLYGRLRLDFVEHSRSRAVEVYFNTVMDWLYREALELLLRGIGGHWWQYVGNNGSKSGAGIEALPIKFRNGIRRYSPGGDNVLGFLHWPAAVESKWILLQQERVPEGVLALTNTQLLLISEEKALWRGKSSQNARYGYVVTYCPLSRVASIQLRDDEFYPVVDVTLCASQLRRVWKINFSEDCKTAVNAFVNAVSSRILLSTRVRPV